MSNFHPEHASSYSGSFLKLFSEIFLHLFNKAKNSHASATFVVFTLAGLFVPCAMPCANANTVSETLRFLNDQVHERYRLEPSLNGFAEKYIQQGIKVIMDVLDDNYTRPTNLGNEMRDFLAFHWALYHLGCLKQSCFEQGSFVIQDPNHRIFEFLSGNSQSFTRPSSHLGWLKKVTQTSQYGVDILGKYLKDEDVWEPFISGNSFGQYLKIFKSDRKEAYLLPTQKSHVLFGLMKGTPETFLVADQVFIKIEDHGLRTAMGAIVHMKDWLDIQLGNLFQNQWGVGTITTYWRVEDLTQVFVDIYSNFVRLAQPDMTTNELKQELKLAKELGIRYILARTQDIYSQGSLTNEAIVAMNQISSELQSQGYDHLNLRTGGEVILTIEELMGLISKEVD